MVTTTTPRCTSLLASYSLLSPTAKAPPWIHTITGRPLVAVMMPIVVIGMAPVVAVRIVIAAPVGRVHVEEQAILGHRRVAEGRCSLRTMVAEFCRVLRDGRGRHGLRRLPAQIQGHRLGVADAEEFPHGAGGVELALELAVRRCHQRGARERPVSRRGQCEGCAEQHGAERAPQPRSRPRRFLPSLNGSDFYSEHDVSSR